MATVSVRRQGGAAIMTIPSEVMKTLRIDVGSELEIVVGDGIFTAQLKAKQGRRRYSLRELLSGATPSAMQRLKKETAWMLDGDPVGRERG